ncbi:unnamed protein product [Protopolystoma xenopodis]|uniref:Uncharacterized protein n=1 Tax=Protopolystoma xenopodis TaxID=117903 RepID=A0A448X5K6_9PLAT|nr:unnamed protein product [Protopolystoma xenopodis]
MLHDAADVPSLPLDILDTFQPMQQQHQQSPSLFSNLSVSPAISDELAFTLRHPRLASAAGPAASRALLRAGFAAWTEALAHCLGRSADFHNPSLDLVGHGRRLADVLLSCHVDSALFHQLTTGLTATNTQAFQLSDHRKASSDSHHPISTSLSACLMATAHPSTSPTG